MKKRLKIGLILIPAMAVFAVTTIMISKPAHPDTQIVEIKGMEPPLDRTNVTTPEQKTQTLETPEEPASLQGISRETYNSPYGFTITYPNTWHAEEYPARPEEGVLGAWSVSPSTVPKLDASVTPLVVIQIYNVPSDITEGVYSGTGTDRTLSEPDYMQGQMVVELNGMRGIYTTGFGGVSTYDFKEGDRRFNILINDTLLRKESLSEAELRWVISTLQITQ